ncbi:MAG: type II secretion system protein GspG, partial [Planctomycetes bacterium]|nr:type II secretion system protein GspG [Planctomycetota bacterium]
MDTKTTCARAAAVRAGASGFTLIEVLLVVVIITILASLVVPRFVGRTEEARKAAAKAQIETAFGSALDLYELDNGQYPTTQQGLAALREKPGTAPVPNNWKGPYLKKDAPRDPWGNE